METLRNPYHVFLYIALPFGLVANVGAAEKCSSCEEDPKWEYILYHGAKIGISSKGNNRC